MSSLILDVDYRIWIYELKSRIQKSQIKASLSVNKELILLYWDLGNQIVRKQEISKWGSGFLEQLSNDLKLEFPEMNGFSKRNLEIIRQWFLFFENSGSIAKQLVSQLEIKEMNSDR
jgi:predicted nuclease of restriction endonuclease-like (RecB) superfamily